MSALIFSDELSEIVFMKSLILSWPAGVVYLEPGRRFSSEGLSGVTVSSVYDLEDVKAEIKAAGKDELIIVGGAPLLRNFSQDSLIDLRALSDEAGTTLVLYHLPLSINELDLASEFKRYYHTPELMDYLMVMRTSSYRGHYRMSLSVIRAPHDFVTLIGDHVFSIDSALSRVVAVSSSSQSPSSP